MSDEGVVIGPMPPADFLEHFLHPSMSSRPTDAQFRLRKSSNTDGEPILSVEGDQVVQNLVFHRLPLPDGTNDRLPMPPSPRLLAHASSLSPRAGSPAPAELIFEYVEHDPFRDPKPGQDDFWIFRSSARPRATLRRHSRLIKEMIEARPDFTFLFSVLVTDQGARLLRWDRAGAIVTEMFDYKANDNPLTDFVWRFAHMPLEHRGHDTSFSIPTMDESTFARAAFSRSDHVQVSPETLLHKVAVQDDISGERTFYVVADPYEYREKVWSHATRSYVAVDLRDGSLVWLKDTWRTDSVSSYKEGDVYRKLEENHVPHIAPLRCAGDVGTQATRTHELSQAPWVCFNATTVVRSRYRMVLGVIGRPLNTFKSTHQLFTAIRDAVVAHSKAYTEAGILHGDISSGNILITDDGEGLLIDWELAFDAATKPLSHIGTWPFVAARLMDKVETDLVEPQLGDELESFFHVLMFHLVRHRPSGIHCLKDEIDNVFFAGMKDGLPHITAMHKGSFFHGAYWQGPKINDYFSKPCINVIEELRRLFFRATYAAANAVTPAVRQSALDALKTSDHFLKVFNTALEDESWPEDDGSMDAVAANMKKYGWTADPSPISFETLTSTSSSCSSVETRRSLSRGPTPAPTPSSSTENRPASVAAANDARSNTAQSTKRKSSSPAPTPAASSPPGKRSLSATSVDDSGVARPTKKMRTSGRFSSPSPSPPSPPPAPPATLPSPSKKRSAPDELEDETLPGAMRSPKRTCLPARSSSASPPPSSSTPIPSKERSFPATPADDGRASVAKRRCSPARSGFSPPPLVPTAASPSEKLSALTSCADDALSGTTDTLKRVGSPARPSSPALAPPSPSSPSKKRVASAAFADDSEPEPPRSSKRRRSPACSSSVSSSSQAKQ